MRIRSIILGSAVLLASACGGDDPSGPPYADFSGEWRGSLTGINVRLYLTDDDGAITGTGILSAGQTLSITVSGDHDHPNVEFTAYAPGYDSFSYDGRFEDANTIDGIADGSGFTDDRLLLIRQPAGGD